MNSVAIYVVVVLLVVGKREKKVLKRVLLCEVWSSFALDARVVGLNLGSLKYVVVKYYDLSYLLCSYFQILCTKSPSGTLQRRG